MQRMLATSQVNEIRRLLETGNYSQRKIARMTGVSRGSIGAIAGGRRPDYENRLKEDDETGQPQGPPGRCETCGALVYPPCRLCTLRRQLALKRQIPPLPGPLVESQPPEPLGLELRDEHRKRYEQVRRGRMKAERKERERIGCTQTGETGK